MTITNTKFNHQFRSLLVSVMPPGPQNPSPPGSENPPSPTSDATSIMDVSKEATPTRGGMTSSDDPSRSPTDDANPDRAQGSGEGASNERPC